MKIKIVIIILFIAAIILGAWFFLISKTPGGGIPSGNPPENNTEATNSAEVVPPEIISGQKSIFYEDKKFGFQIWYPENAKIDKQSSFYLSVPRQIAIGIFLPESLATGTNLLDAGVFIGIDSSSSAVQNCLSPTRAEIDDGTTTLNGAEVRVFRYIGAGAGNIYKSKMYRLIKEGSCYEIAELLHSSNVDNYPAGTVKQFDEAKFLGI